MTINNSAWCDLKNWVSARAFEFMLNPNVTEILEDILTKMDELKNKSDKTNEI